jgi:hypothetical protein
MKLKIGEIESLFKDIFMEEEGLVNSVETVYELSGNEDFYRLVISLHGVTFEETSIIHTKFIFKTDLDKRWITDMSFIYLWDINCIYHKNEFKNILDLKKKIVDIFKGANFGEDIIILSDFIEAPAMFLNYYMRRAKITDYSIFDVKYSPKFKTVPCDKMTFDFIIDVNNNYKIDVSIHKIDKKSDDKDDNIDQYKFHFKFMDDIITKTSDTLKNIHFFIGDGISSILDKKIKNNSLKENILNWEKFLKRGL